jgi:hypothetical protein
MVEPTQVFAGDTLAWTRDLADHPADTWTLTYYFVNETDSFNIVATADGTTHSVSIGGATTGAYKSGRYRWHARVTDGTTVTTVDQGWFEVKPDPAKLKTDWRSHARKMIDAIESTLEGNASKQQLDLISYSFGAVNVNRDKELLMRWRDRYARELHSDEGGSGFQHIGIRFARP